MAGDATHRIDTLAARIRWLDRYRRTLSLMVGCVAFVLLAYKIARMFGDDSPNVVSVIVGLKLAAVAWWLTEAAFAWTIALWEVRHDRLARATGLPVAVLLRK